jgi:hypothetical protein
MKKLLLIPLLIFFGCSKLCIKEDTPERLNQLQHQADSTGQIVYVCLQDENCYMVTYIFYPKIKPVNIVKNQLD